METRRLGRTDLRVVPVGFGGIPIQRVSRKEATELIRHAIDKGINFFDTARGYTDSEEKLGFGLTGLRQQVVLASKSMARTAKDLATDIDTSLRNLQTDWIDLYQCHNVGEKDWDQLQAPDGGLEALEKARSAGKIRYIGITGHRPDLLAKIVQKYPFVSVQFPYNYIEQENRQELLAEIKQRELGTIIMKPLAGGALRQTGAALRFLLNHGFDIVIPGVDGFDQVNENLSQVGKVFSEADKAALEGEKEELGQGFCRRCEYCLPCSAGIHIPTMFLLEGYYDRYDLPDWARQRYTGMAVKADACTECGMCEERCPYGLPIRRKLKRVHEILA